MGDEAQKTWEKYPAALPEGSILAGQYIIQDVLGQGGFGITYLAEDYQSKEKVAVKEFFPESMVMRQGSAPQVTAYSGSRQENFRYGLEKFLDEAKILAQFQGNPNIVGVRSYFEENGTAYFVMDYIEGMTLKAYIQKSGGKLGWEEVWNILCPVMDALEAVHRKGIIHRDVTPDNIFIADDHTVKLLDFGAARYSLGDRSQSLDVVVKAGYAPMEQYVRRGKQGPYTDVYSLAACFYSALCGYLPPESLNRLDEEDLVSLSTRGVKLPKGVEEAILKALEVRAKDRFQTMGEFKKAILDSLWVESEPEPNPIPEPEPDPGRMEKLLKFLKENRVKVAGVVAAAALAGGIFAVQRENARMQEETAVLEIQEAEQQNAQDINGSTAEKEAPDKEGDDVEEPRVEEEKEVSNILMAEAERELDWDEPLEALEGVLGNPDLKPTLIKKVTFFNTQENIPEDSWDVSSRKDGSVMAWTEEKGDGYFDLYIAAEGNIVLESGNSLFYGYRNLEEINFNDCIDTSQVTDMEDMFYHCSMLKKLDVSGFNTSRVTNMGVMFCQCLSLEELNVSNFDTGQVTDMGGMFSNCEALKELDVSNFNTGQVTDMGYMFNSCYALEELDVSNFDTGQVTDMENMFFGCYALEELDVSNFDTGQVTDMGGMFSYCYALKELDVSNFNTGQVTDMGGMFSVCEALKELDVSNFDTDKVTDMGYMFGSCYALEELDVSNFDTGQVTDMGYMFSACKALKELDVSNFDTGQVTDMRFMFGKCSSLEELNVSNFDTGQVTDMGYMFFVCKALKELDVSNFNIDQVTDMEDMFKDCTSLPKPNVSWYDRTLTSN